MQKNNYPVKLLPNIIISHILPKTHHIKERKNPELFFISHEHQKISLLEKSKLFSTEAISRNLVLINPYVEFSCHYSLIGQIESEF